jgi:hypothetical protein
MSASLKTHTLALLLLSPCCATAATLDLAAAPVPAGLTPLRTQQEYSPATLYEIINGQAEIYLPYGFRKMSFITFAPANAPDDAFEVEVNEMATPLDAFGLYSYLRSRDDLPAAVGTEGRMGTTQLSFYLGNCFVRVRSVQPRNEADRLLAIGRAIASLLPAQTAPPRELQLLKVEGVRESTLTYATRSLLGLEFFPKGLQAEAVQAGREFQLLNLFFDNAEAAQEALSRFQHYLDSIHATHQWHDTDMGKVLEISEPDTERALFHAVGSHLVAVAGPEVTPATALPALRALAANQAALMRLPAFLGAPDTLTPLQLTLPKPQFIGTPRDIKTANLEAFQETPPEVLVPPGLANVALGKPVAASVFQPLQGKLTQITDGDKEAAPGSVVEIEPGLQYVQIDLESMHEVFAVALWHYHWEARVYFTVILQLANDPDFIDNVVTIFNNDHDNRAGMGAGSDKEYIETHMGRIFKVDGVKARYLRAYSQGNTSDNMNHYIEIEAYGRPTY